MTLFVCYLYLFLFINLPATLKKSMARWNCQKRINFFCCPVFWRPLLPVDVVQNNCILSCAVLLVVELAFSGFGFVHLALVQIKLNFYYYLCCLFLLFTLFVLFWMLGLVGKEGKPPGVAILLRGARAGWLNYFFFFNYFSVFVFLLFKNSFL